MIVFVKNFVRFSRLHTVVGTTISLLSLYYIALGLNPVEYRHFPDFLMALLACLAANIYIVGLNQITDVEIDKINKPYLPLASGAFSMRLGYILVLSSLALSLAIALWYEGYLMITIMLSLLLGTAYSLPPIRLKRFHFWAAFCIIAVRGLIVNFFLYLHFQYTLAGTHRIPSEIYLLAGMMFIFSIIIAWFKDVPDMEGDESHEISTLSIRLGAKKVFLIGNGILTVGLLAVVFLSLSINLEASRLVLATGHIGILAALWSINMITAFQKEDAFKEVKSWFPRYYQLIWLLFFAVYLVFAVAA
jgi:homogentisate phytyltransferase/homogentisate geranylgeranyltransferase